MMSLFGKLTKVRTPNGREYLTHEPKEINQTTRQSTFDPEPREKREKRSYTTTSQPTQKQQVLDYIKENPGEQTLTVIGAALGTSSSTVSRRIQELVEEGKVVERGSIVHRERYVADEHRDEKPERERKSRTKLSTKQQRQNVLEYIRNHPGHSTLKDISDSVGISEQTVQARIHELKRQGKISITGGPRSHGYYARGENPTKRSIQDRLGDVSKEDIDRTYEYIKAHHGQKITLRELNEAISKTPSNPASYLAILNLEKQGLIRREMVGKSNISGFRYFVEGSPEPVEGHKLESSTVTPVTQSIDSLAWEFIKETGSHDLVQFIKWLGDK